MISHSGFFSCHVCKGKGKKYKDTGIVFTTTIQSAIRTNHNLQKKYKKLLIDSLFFRKGIEGVPAFNFIDPLTNKVRIC